jgi:hypothetical protein
VEIFALTLLALFLILRKVCILPLHPFARHFGLHKTPTGKRVLALWFAEFYYSDY